MKQIDEEGYKAGGAAFQKGKTLRNVVEVMIAKMKEADEDPKSDWKKAEAFFNSYAIGFADALLAKLRSR